MPRALFDCISETRHAYGGAREYRLQAVTPKAGSPDVDDPEVNAFWSATPQGTLTITITNPAAYLEVGERYYLDLMATGVLQAAAG